MNGQADRCDRTAYVSGLQPTISDIELFEVFNRVAHVEKVIVRNGAVRHALVVFKTVQGLYQVLINFQGTSLHGRQLHIRPLRESSHANSETIQTMFERVKIPNQNQNQQNQQNQRRSSSVNEAPPTSQWNLSNYQQQRGYRNPQNGNGRRRGGGGGYPRGFMNGTAPLMNLFDAQPPPPIPQYPGYPGGGGDPYHQQNQMIYEDYTEGAKRFDSLANLIRSSTPTDPFSNYHKPSDNSTRPRTPRDPHHHRHAPPTWKMELQIKQETEDVGTSSEVPNSTQGSSGGVLMTPQEFLAQIAQQNALNSAETAENEKKKKQRPNLSVINPSLFYEQYPRTSSPVVTFAPNSTPIDKSGSPCDPAVVAYSRLLPAPPQSAFDGLSPIDTNNCSFITKHLGNSEKSIPEKRDLTNDELSDMIVSTGNLRMNPPGCHVDSDQEGPAPWSPLKRLRAESGCGGTVASPQFSPIKPKKTQEEMIMMMDSEEDDVFGGSGLGLGGGGGGGEKIQNEEEERIGGRKMSGIEDINNSRLPSNSHSAAPGSDQKTFVFPPEYPMCRHSSVPSIAHLVGDLSDFCPLSPHLDKMQESIPRVEDSEDVDKTSDEKSREEEDLLPRGIVEI